ncbi:MAG: hypothetical protein GMKNLPBB_00840 [Myxococcota bacterium]|nr:hypothetical protein [Myxococcota bacterium]
MEEVKGNITARQGIISATAAPFLQPGTNAALPASGPHPRREFSRMADAKKTLRRISLFVLLSPVIAISAGCREQPPQPPAAAARPVEPDPAAAPIPIDPLPVVQARSPPLTVDEMATWSNERLIKAMSGDDEVTGLQAVFTLSQRKDSEAHAGLLAGFRSQHPRVVKYAVLMAAAKHPPGAEDALGELLFRPAAPIREVLVAARMLAAEGMIEDIESARVENRDKKLDPEFGQTLKLLRRVRKKTSAVLRESADSGPLGELRAELARMDEELSAAEQQNGFRRPEVPEDGRCASGSPPVFQLYCVRVFEWRALRSRIDGWSASAAGGAEPE